MPSALRVCQKACNGFFEKNRAGDFYATIRNFAAAFVEGIEAHTKRLRYLWPARRPRHTRARPSPAHTGGHDRRSQSRHPARKRFRHPHTRAISTAPRPLHTWAPLTVGSTKSLLRSGPLVTVSERAICRKLAGQKRFQQCRRLSRVLRSRPPRRADRCSEDFASATREQNGLTPRLGGLAERQNFLHFGDTEDVGRKFGQPPV